MFSTRFLLSNNALRSNARQMPSFRFNLFNEDDVVFKASQIPWEEFHLCLPKDDDPITAATTSQATLSKKLDELARITIIVGKPQRIWPTRPKHGVIGDHLVGQKTSWPPRLVSKKIEAPVSETNAYAGIPIFAPKPIIPLDAACAAFEVQAAAGVLSEAEPIPPSATFPDENARSIHVTTQNDSDAGKDTANVLEGPVIPASHNRGYRQPLGVLYNDEEVIPPSGRVAPFVEPPSPEISEPGCRVAPFVEPPSPEISESGSDVSSGSGSAKGWVRLRLKAPPAIKITPFVEMCRMEQMARSAELSTGSVTLPKSVGLSTSNILMVGTVLLPPINTPVEGTSGN
ncbi:hypothetical protein C0989_003555 [Termitomyces sp. Mn162]|nr:hypothetical protein C0989_003555 [Termitomyces sp. Mn162]